MTSGEWDLRALKALEEEEQKEFLALSQKSLFEPPSPPAQAKLQQQQQQHINAQHLIHAALTEREKGNGQQTTTYNATAAAAASTTTNYMQLQAQQLLKLPTINEHHQHQHQHLQQQYLLKNTASTTQDNSGKVARGEVTGGGRLKFTKVLSLSAHSLTNRFGGGGGSGGGLKKFKKTSCSNSPSHYGSPLYTPPPTRRCNTLHHSQPQVRKAFKTLQQLEKQKQERKQELQSKNRTLQRIAGTNKTYWKYGINSTANSITQQHQQKLQKRKSITSELESNTSDELGSEETQPIDGVVKRLKEERELIKELAAKNIKVNDNEHDNEDENNNDDNDDDDGNTDIGSCSVPLASDSIEMMSLMLTAASTAVKTQTLTPSLTTPSSPPPPPPPDIAATGGATTATTMVGFNEFPKYFTLNHHNLSGGENSIVSNDNEETVAYEAFHKMFSRRKSFAGEKMLRTQTLQRNSSLQHDVEQQPKQQLPQPKSLHNSQQAYRNVNNRPLLKSSSVEAPLSSYMDFNINSTSIIANPLTNTGGNNNKNKVNSLSGGNNQKTRESFKRKLLNSPANLLTSLPYGSGMGNTEKASIKTTTTICNPLCSSQLQQHLEYQQYLQQQQQKKPAYQHHHHQHQHQQLQQHAHHTQQHLQHLLDNGNNDLNVATTTPLLSSSSSALVIDDELEEHIKQCSCSCNHMGYGNSMDYQHFKMRDN